jgi:hypothetical protein
MLGRSRAYTIHIGQWCIDFADLTQSKVAAIGSVKTEYHFLAASYTLAVVSIG